MFHGSISVGSRSCSIRALLQGSSCRFPPLSFAGGFLSRSSLVGLRSLAVRLVASASAPHETERLPGWIPEEVQRTIDTVSGHGPHVKSWFLEFHYNRFGECSVAPSKDEYARLWRHSRAEMWQRVEVVAEIFTRVLLLVQNKVDSLRPELIRLFQIYLLKNLDMRVPDNVMWPLSEARRARPLEYLTEIEEGDVVVDEEEKSRIVQEAAQDSYGEVVKLLHAQKLLSKNIPLPALKAWTQEHEVLEYLNSSTPCLRTRGESQSTVERHPGCYPARPLSKWVHLLSGLVSENFLHKRPLLHINRDCSSGSPPSALYLYLVLYLYMNRDRSSGQLPPLGLQYLMIAGETYLYNVESKRRMDQNQRLRRKLFDWVDQQVGRFFFGPRRSVGGCGFGANDNVGRQHCSMRRASA